MQLSIPKQFVPLAGQPVLMHTLTAFHRCSFSVHTVVVLPEAEIETWKKLCRQHNFVVSHHVVAGGSTRSASVYQGLQRIEEEESLVAVHDGVRPLVTPTLIERSYQEAEQYGSAVASVPLKDSIRYISETGSEVRTREHYRLMQTPQTFRTHLLRKAYEQIGTKSFSDDASVMEHSGHAIRLIDGEYRNLKITTPEDLTVAAALLSQTEA